MKRCSIVICLLLFTLGAASPREAAFRVGPLPDPILDVPYVPTPQRLVRKMLQMAGVTPDDVLYDLGCGDGRVVITAAKEMGTRGLGVDLDPRRIEESRANAIRDKVNDKVTFREQDLFETDIREATVLSLYLLPDVNLRLRPKILREMRPGSRVVSHDYRMGEWEPDDQGDSIYFWVVPANLSGTWACTFSSDQGSDSFTLVIDQRFQRIDGVASKGSAQVALKEARLTGDRVEFTIEQKQWGQRGSMRFEGRVQGDVVEGTVTRQGREQGSSTWTGRRDPSTTRDIDRDEEVK